MTRGRWARRAIALLAGAVLIGAGAAPAAQAAGAPHVIVWSGGLDPGGPAAGVELRADGTGRRMLAGEDGAVHVQSAFAPKGAQLAAIRVAAASLLASGPSVTHAGGAQDGGYVSVLLERGEQRRAVVDTGADSARVTALLKAINAALPAGQALAGAGPSPLRFRVAPAVSPCPPGQHATDVVKQVPMQQAAAAGLVQLTPKGEFGGDSVAVDGTWKPLAAPATVTVHLEITRAADDATDWATLVKGKLDAAYAGYKVDGQPVTFAFDVVNHDPGAGPRPCYHQIAMHLRNDVRSYVGDLGPAASNGEWAAPDARAWPHEVGHLLGVDDHYNDFFHVKRTGADLPLPQRGLDGDALNAALPHGIRAGDGVVISKPWKGYENDLMATARGRLRQADIAALVAGADIDVHDDAGDVLLNKDSADQNLMTGAPFDLRIPKDGTAHVDGLVAYCIDLSRHIPGASGKRGFDVFGPVGVFGGEAAAALQRLAAVIAAHQPAPLAATPGANDAIWRVTDDADASNDAAASALLVEAGIPPAAADKTYAAPHYDDPNAAGATTSGFSPTGSLDVPGSPVEGAPPAAAPVPKLLAIQALTRRLRATRGRGRAVLTARVVVDGAPEPVAVQLVARRRGRTVVVARRAAEPMGPGEHVVALAVRRLRPGAYRLVARGPAGQTIGSAQIRVLHARRR